LVTAFVRLVHSVVRRQALHETLQLALQLFNIRVLRRLVELLKVMHDPAYNLGQFHP
jgi:hypothetical protein